MAISVAASPIVITFRIRTILSTFPPAARDPNLDIELDCGANNDFGVIPLTITQLGDWFCVHVVADPIEITFSISGESYVVDLWATTPIIPLTITLHSYGITLETTRKNWIKWSGIGNLDFTIGKDNIAGERPMDWKGWVYRMMKLGGKVVAYGQNGVTFLTPVNNLWGMSTVSRIGLKGRGAVCGTEFMHFYVDAIGRLCKVAETIELLDYKEFLGLLSDAITLSYDELNQLVYICDGTTGYVYSVLSKSLGEGPANVTGIGYQSGAQWVVAPADVVIEPFDICTDIFDLGNRKNKTIASVEVGADLSAALYIAIDYRLDKSVAFATTPWVRVNPNGVTPLPCFGVEFRFRLKTLVYEQFELDYLRINGVIHNYSYLDSFSREGK